MRSNRFSLNLCLTATMTLLSACAETATYAPGVATPPPSRRLAPLPQLRPGQPGAVHIQDLPGLEGVIGATRPQLTRVFGAPRLDVIEGDVRKLQFTGTACVLDIYLYPLSPGQEPQATYVDARRSDGRDVDRAACVAAMRQAPH